MTEKNIYRAWAGYVGTIPAADNEDERKFILAHRGHPYDDLSKAMAEARQAGGGSRGWVEKDGQIAHTTELKRK